MASEPEVAAMRRAFTLARSAGVPAGPNPRVGCVILSPDGVVVAEGFHRGAGTPHAEVAALESAGSSARGATAIVTLEPCNHVGRTGPCSVALIDAGIARVVFSQADPHAVAAGGSAVLAAAGIDVEGALLVEEAHSLTEAWTFAVTRGRPLVTLKVAATLDGRVAARDGSSRWITGEPARAQVHDLREEVDAIAVGSGTVSADDPQLTARDATGALVRVQPLRVVIGMRDLPAGARVRDAAAETLHLRTHDPLEVIAVLQAREIRHLLLEGGPTVATAFLASGLVDRLVWYVAPALLGAGIAAIGDFGVGSIADAVRLTEVRVDQVGDDARIRGHIG